RMQVRTFSRNYSIPRMTVTDALKSGALPRAADGGVDPGDPTVQSWITERRARPPRALPDPAARRRLLLARIASTKVEIKRLKREISTLKDTTFTRALAEAAHANSHERLQWALSCLPALAVATAAKQLKRPTQVIEPILEAFVAQVRKDTQL